MRAFTLVELILVMALLVTLLALAMPSVFRSVHQRNLEQEATRLLALTEYGRDEAASLGIPIVVWLDPDTRRFGIGPKAGYTGNAAATKEYTLPADLDFVAPDSTAASKTPGHGFDVAQFDSDGTLDLASVAAMYITDHAKARAGIAQTSDGYGYQIVKEAGR